VKTLWLLVRRTAQEYGADNCSHMAAAISYYVLFSVIPLSIFTISIFGMVVRDDDLQQEVADEIVDFLNVEKGVPLIEPNETAIDQQYGAETLSEIEAALGKLTEAAREEMAASLDDEQTVTVAGRTLGPEELTVRNENIVTDTLEGISNLATPLTFVGLVGMGWAAAAMFGAVRKALNIAWDTDAHRPLVQQKLIDLSIVLGLGVLLSASVAGTGALRTLRTLSDENLGPLSEGTGFFWAVMPFFLPAFFSFVVFLLIYRFVPNAPTRFRDVWPGALVATALFELLKNGFAIYIASFSSYKGAYGALGGILLFLIWTYLSANILLIGAELASEYPRVLRGDYAEEEAQPKEPRPLIETVGRALRGLVHHQVDRAAGLERDGKKERRSSPDS